MDIIPDLIEQQCCQHGSKLFSHGVDRLQAINDVK
jgi:hypothetical protein